MEVVVGIVIAWVVAKARRAATRADGVADAAIDAAVDRVGELVMGKLGGDSAVQRLELEAARGEVGQLTQNRVALSLEAAAADDEEFAVRLREAVAATKADASSVRFVNQTISGTVHGTAIQIAGDVSGDIRL
ncbi:chromosome partitioning protein [Actinokineospora pegani]|uniref:chromosome partitioning protein n=1 Tax=Actinokineospora pegani TaxID=2654637 RepID=UPI0012E99A65|nr:chromosome partitioning protein [Actinokineospora pegani]